MSNGEMQATSSHDNNLEVEANEGLEQVEQASVKHGQKSPNSNVKYT